MSEEGGRQYGQPGNDLLHHATLAVLRVTRQERVQVLLLLLFQFCVQAPSLRLDTGDELGQIYICQESIQSILTSFHYAQNHPLCGILGHYAIAYLPLDRNLAARLPLFVVAMTVPSVFYFTHRHWVDRRAALLVAFLFVLVDPFFFYATVLRGYAILVLGVLISNAMVLGYLRQGGSLRLLAYVGAAVIAGYAHLWMLVSILAQALYILVRATVPWKPRALVLRRSLGLLAACALAVLCLLLLYLPMLPEIVVMAGTRREGTLGREVAVAVLQIVRFGSWTVPAYMVLIPVLVEGYRRQRPGSRLDEVLQLHLLSVLTIAGVALLVCPVNFGTRFLMGMLPGIAAFAAWCLSGLWRDLPVPPAVPTRAVWLVGFALGVLLANVEPTYAMGSRDRQHFLYVGLPQTIGTGVATGLLIVGMLWERFRTSEAAAPSRPRLQMEIGLCTVALLLALIPPILLSPRPGFWFELHMPLMGLTCLLAWRLRSDRRALYRLRYALLACLAGMVLWQLDFTRWIADWPFWLGVVAIFPPIFVVVSCVPLDAPAWEPG